jgi:hypothetical protein
MVPNEAADFGWGGTEAGQNVGGDEESGWILLVVSARKLDIVLPFVGIGDKLLVFARFAIGALLAPLAENAPLVGS